ncbi:MAG: response regulator transcription factor [Dehalococcoidia bacterium]
MNLIRPMMSARDDSLAAIKGTVAARVRVLLADDHAVLRQALRLLLEMHDEIEIVGDVADGREAIEAAERLRPDVVLMDLAMPGLNGVEATRQITSRVRGVRVLVLTGFGDDERVLDALRAGASGYVVKRSDINELLLAIQSVQRGNLYISASVSEGRSAIDLLIQAQSKRPGPEDTLTEREREILQLVAEGYPNQAIADRLYLSVKTVEAHKAHIMGKLGAQKTADLIRYALRKGIISLDPELSDSRPA